MSPTNTLFIFINIILLFRSTVTQECYSHPITPLNSGIRCRGYSECTTTCRSQYEFPDGETSLNLMCYNGTWRAQNERNYNYTIPDCQPICRPSCLNGGLCISPYNCYCRPNFSGSRCETEFTICRDLPPVPLNSMRSCNARMCTVQCFNNFKLPDGSSNATIICSGGAWVSSTNSSWTTIPSCQPVCEPSCRNGGRCFAYNKCQCFGNFKGPQCQYECQDQMPPVPVNSRLRCSSNGACVATCRPDYQFPGGQTVMNISCEASGWRAEDGQSSLPDCDPICNPPCLNGGECASPNVCLCKETFSGPTCQHENKYCDAFPSTPLNAFKNCNSRRCVLQCAPGFKFPDNTSSMTQTCHNGTWFLSNPLWNRVPNCQPE